MACDRATRLLHSRARPLRSGTWLRSSGFCALTLILISLFLGNIRLDHHAHAVNDNRTDARKNQSFIAPFAFIIPARIGEVVADQLTDPGLYGIEKYMAVSQPRQIEIRSKVLPKLLRVEMIRVVP